MSSLFTGKQVHAWKQMLAKGKLTRNKDSWNVVDWKGLPKAFAWLSESICICCGLHPWRLEAWHFKNESWDFPQKQFIVCMFLSTKREQSCHESYTMLMVLSLFGSLSSVSQVKMNRGTDSISHAVYDVTAKTLPAYQLFRNTVLSDLVCSSFSLAEPCAFQLHWDGTSCLLVLCS